MVTDYHFQTFPLTKEEEHHLRDIECLPEDEKNKDSVYVKHLHNLCVDIWKKLDTVLKTSKPGTWQHELAEEMLPHAVALCNNFVRK